MALDFSEFFKQYEELVASADKVFETVRSQHEELVTCKQGCSDCCHAIFDLSLIEALYIHDKFKQLSEDRRQTVLNRADEAERKQHRLVRKAFKAKEKGADTEKLMAELSKERVRCPMLNDDESCELYDHRPVTCRLYGIPLIIEGRGHTCGRTGFKEGEQYPTANLNKLQDRMVEISNRLADSINTRYDGLGTLHVPVSVAIMNDWSEDYLGVRKPDSVLEDDEVPEQKLITPMQSSMDCNTGSCSPSDCASCASASTGGCSGQPQTITLGGNNDA